MYTTGHIAINLTYQVLLYTQESKIVVVTTLGCHYIQTGLLENFFPFKDISSTHSLLGIAHTWWYVWISTAKLAENMELCESVF